MPSIHQTTFWKCQLSHLTPLFLSGSPLPQSILPSLLPPSCAESWQHTQAGSTWGHRNLAARLTLAAAKGKEFQARAPLSAFHFSELIGFSFTFSMAQMDLWSLKSSRGFYHNGATGEDFRAFSGNARYSYITVAELSGYCVSKATWQTTNSAISVKLSTTTENKSLTPLEQAMDSSVHKNWLYRR